MRSEQDVLAATSPDLLAHASAEQLRELVTDLVALAAQLRERASARAPIEQAKGMLAHALDVPPERAFELLRAYSQHTNVKLSTITASLLADRAVLAGFVAHVRAVPPTGRA